MGIIPATGTSFVVFRPKPRKTPHDESRCEACKRGYCSQAVARIGTGRPRRQAVVYRPPAHGVMIRWVFQVRWGSH